MTSKTCPGCHKQFKKGEPYPGVSMCEVCERYGTPKEDKLLRDILHKIDEGVVTCDDFNKLIKETTPESVRDRLRRRTIRNTTDDHIDEIGHQQLKLPEFAKRINPKRKPIHQQNHGRSDIAHVHSARTQKRTMPNKFDEAIIFIKNNIGKPIAECDLSQIERRELMLVATKMMTMPNIDRDWLSTLCAHMDTNCG